MLRFILLLGCLILYPITTADIAPSSIQATDTLPAVVLPKRHVLVIYSYHDTLPWQAKIREALFARLQTVPIEQRPELFEERFEAHRLSPLISNRLVAPK